MNFLQVSQVWYGKRWIFLVLLALAVSTSGAAAYFFIRYQEERNDTVIQSGNLTRQLQSQDEIKNLIAEIGRFFVLPDETPTLATVTDPERLRGQAFFAKAKRGDKVLIFTRAQKAILYDPVVNKIIEVAPLNIGAPAPAPSQ